MARDSALNGPLSRYDVAVSFGSSCLLVLASDRMMGAMGDGRSLGCRRMGIASTQTSSKPSSRHPYRHRSGAYSVKELGREDDTARRRYQA
jgi:hypothetical protein